MSKEVIIGVAKVVPAVCSATYATFTLNEWAAIFAIVYSAVMLILALHSRYLLMKDRKKNENSKTN